MVNNFYLTFFNFQKFKEMQIVSFSFMLSSISSSNEFRHFPADEHGSLDQFEEEQGCSQVLYS